MKARLVRRTSVCQTEFVRLPHLLNQFLVHLIEVANNILVPSLHFLLVTSFCHHVVRTYPP